MASKVQPATGRKPPNAGKGRKKGVPNKLTADVKAMILAALDKAGGVEYLLAQSKANPNAFLTLVGKVLPLTLSGDPENPVGFTVIERRIVKPD
jgi:hypothetical protein